MLLRRARSSTHAITTRAATEQQNDITRSRTLTTYIIRLDSTHNSTYLQALSNIIGVVDLTHMRSGKTYLIAVARIACRSLCRYYALRELALHSLVNRLIYITGTRNTHSLIYVATTRQWVTDSTSKTC